ncbi:hypothetical protein FS837_007860 [Tulasnella sp. UAMH 9824]|nr:hypothetical protein FS837_007860 [Tulasnella sp. UAMH 9824]
MSDSTSKVRSTKLTFKGDKKGKKRKRKDKDVGGHDSGGEGSDAEGADPQAGSATINLRTPDGKFMSCDQHGVVSSDREARGPQEEWTPVILPDAPGMVAFQSYYSKYLSIDETAGGTMSLRCDSEEVGFNERFFVKVQAEYKRKAGRMPVYGGRESLNRSTGEDVKDITMEV